MKLRVLIHKEVTEGCDALEAASQLRKIADEVEQMTITAPRRIGVKDLDGKNIGFWSIQREG